MNNIINHLNVLTLNVGYAHHEADWNWQTVQSPFARLYLVTEGEAYVKMNNMNIHLTPGHLYLIPALQHTIAYVQDIFVTIMYTYMKMLMHSKVPWKNMTFL